MSDCLQKILTNKTMFLFNDYHLKTFKLTEFILLNIN